MWDLIMTARWARVDPEELLEKPLFWYDWYHTCMLADQAMQRENERRAQNALRRG